MSKRSLRTMAVVAGAALALGTMAPAMADRNNGDDVSSQAVIGCLDSDILPGLFPINANVSPANIFSNFPGLLDLGLNSTSNDPDDGGEHIGLLGSPLYGALGTAGYLLGGVINTGTCVTTQVVTCVAQALGRVFPLNINVNPGHPVQTLHPDGVPGLPLFDGLEGGLLDIGIHDTDNVDNNFDLPLDEDDDGPHLGVFDGGFPGGILGTYGVPNTLAYVGAVAFEVAGCLGLPNPLSVVGCIGDLGDIFPLNANVNPGDPVRLFDDLGGLLDIGLGDTDNEDDGDSGHLGLFGLGLLGTYGIGDTVGHLLSGGDLVECVLGGGDDNSGFGLLSSVTGMTGGLGLGGSSLAPLSLLSPVTGTVFSLTSSVTSTLGLSILGGGAGLDASLLASVAAIL